MKTEIIAETEIETVKLSNGFQRGQWVKFLEIRDGKWEVVRTVSTGECTRTTDDKISGLEVRLEGKGVVGGYHGVSAHTYVNNVPTFFGFTAEELDSPTPEKGYTVETLGVRTEAWAEVVTLRDYIIAKFSNRSFHPWSERGDGVHEMPYQWGDQASTSFALVLNGELVDAVTGCGDRAPYLTESAQKCVADRKIHHSDKMTDWAIERGEAQNRLYAAIDRGNLQAWRMVKNHLTSSYRISHNPLPTLRKKYGGTWTYFGPGGMDSDADEGAVMFLEIEELSEASKGWKVIYKPATVK